VGPLRKKTVPHRSRIIYCGWRRLNFMTAIWKDSMEMRSSDLTGTCTVCSAANFKYVFRINFAGSGTERTTGK
jgi:hypothetical protein